MRKILISLLVGTSLSACANIVHVDGQINQFAAHDIAAKITQNKAQTIIVKLNSEGGYVKDGDVIIKAIKEAKAHSKVVTKVSGICYSMCFSIFLAGDEREADDNSRFMIHRAAKGSSIDMDQTLATIDYYVQHGVNRFWLNEQLSRGVMMTINGSHYFNKQELNEKVLNVNWSPVN